MIVLHVVRASMNALWEQSRKEISIKLIPQPAQIAEPAQTRAQQELLTLNDKTKGKKGRILIRCARFFNKENIASLTLCPCGRRYRIKFGMTEMAFCVAILVVRSFRCNIIGGGTDQGSYGDGHATFLCRW